MSTATEVSAPPKIHGAIIEIMRAVGPIAKSQRNTQQSFDYRGIDMVYNAVHPHFAEHGVYSTSEVVKAEHREGEKNNKTFLHAILHMRFTFWAADGSHVSTEVVGEGQDYSGDKASNKAMSIADKYAILQLLKIPTAAVDPDGNLPQHENPPRNENAPRAEPRSKRTAPPPKLNECDKFDVAHVFTQWLVQNPATNGDMDVARTKFQAWVEVIVGRAFPTREIAAWKLSEVNECCKAIGCPTNRELQEDAKR